MKITQLEAYVLRAPDTGRPHWVSHFTVPRANELLVRMRTDDGRQEGRRHSSGWSTTRATCKNLAR